jgi:hypothetical protein
MRWPGASHAGWIANLLIEDSEGKNYQAAALGLGWKLFVPWPREMDDLRRSNLFPILR